MQLVGNCVETSDWQRNEALDAAEPCPVTQSDLLGDWGGGGGFRIKLRSRQDQGAIRERVIGDAKPGLYRGQSDKMCSR